LVITKGQVKSNIPLRIQGRVVQSLKDQPISDAMLV